MENSAESIGSKFNSMRQDGVMIDVIIKCGDKTFPAHKLVLAGSSPYFQAMFTTEMMERQAKEIEIHSENPEIMIQVLDYLYTDNIDITKNTRSILGVAEYLQIDALSRKCCEYLQKPDSLMKAFESWEILDLYQKEQKEDLLNYLAARLSEIYGMKDFLELNISRAQQLIKKSGEMDLSGGNKFATQSDIRIQAIINWVKHDLESRKNLFQNMIDLIDFSAVSCKYLINVVENESWITQIPNAAVRFLTKITSHLWERKQISAFVHFASENTLEIQSVLFKDSLCFDILPKVETTFQSFKRKDILHAFSDKCKIFFLTSSFQVFVYNLETCLWSQIIIDTSLFTHSTSVLSCRFSQGFMYILTEEKFVQYDPSNSFKMREKTPPLISSTTQKENLVEISDKLYCIGGNKYLQEFDLANNKWHQVDFKSQSKFVASLKEKTFFFYCENSELYILTKDLLNLFIVSIPNNRFLTIRGVNLPHPVKQANWLSFHVFSLSNKNNHFKCFLLDDEGNMWIRVTEGNFETWTKDKEVIPLKQESASKSVFFSVAASVHV